MIFVTAHFEPHFCPDCGLCICGCRECTSLGMCACPECPSEENKHICECPSTLALLGDED